MRATPFLLIIMLLIGGIFINAKTEIKPTEPEVSLFNKKGIWNKQGQITTQEINSLKVGDQILKVVLNGKACPVEHYMFALAIHRPQGNYVESAVSNSLDASKLVHMITMRKGDFIICTEITYIKPDGTTAKAKVCPVVSVVE
jgi:hypothetical protein